MGEGRRRDDVGMVVVMVAAWPARRGCAGSFGLLFSTTAWWLKTAASFNGVWCKKSPNMFLMRSVGMWGRGGNCAWVGLVVADVVLVCGFSVVVVWSMSRRESC